MNKKIIQVMFKFRLDYINISCNKCGHQMEVRPPVKYITCCCGNRITLNDYETFINWVGVAESETNER